MKKKLIGGLMIATMVFSSAGAVSAGSIGNVNGIDVRNMDVETALMLVQSQRQQLLDAQLQDQINNAQQMDMLRLQNLSNKRNEAFDVMTNFIKKMQDSRSSIIGNMR
ncbi:hypothetical protein [Aneurinibacillus sp. REN35]|uniref:hypothetical protein n=1 Tax=Aneurinibacillus sp. REN35 TaxID=3237286 RepID=UPI00352866D5